VPTGVSLATAPGGPDPDAVPCCVCVPCLYAFLYALFALCAAFVRSAASSAWA
jgi:hypothetical protein